MSNKLLDREKKQLNEMEFSEVKKVFKEPELNFIEPKLTKHGDATKITKSSGFFGTFNP